MKWPQRPPGRLTGVATNFVDNGDGTYTYTMNKNVTTVAGVTYDPAKTHRMAIRVYGTVAGGTLDEEPLDLTRDFVPSAGGFPCSPIQLTSLQRAPAMPATTSSASPLRTAAATTRNTA